VNLPRSIDSSFWAPRASLLKGGVGQELYERSEFPPDPDLPDISLRSHAGGGPQL
jgi:hypothetical protein